MKWYTQEYIYWKVRGSPINLDVLDLDISWFDIKTLNDIDFEKLPNLQKLNCSYNKLKSFDGIEKISNLTEFNCSCNQLTSLEGIEKLHNLTTLHCGHNQLSSLKEIENLPNLTVLYCGFNQLKSLNGIENLHNLEYLHCDYNQLTSLNGVENLHNLKYLCCDHNQLTSLNSISNLRNLEYINYSGNPIDHIPPNVQRLLNRQRVEQNIYADAQSVHNHSIQESVRQSINNILQFKPVVLDVIELILTDPVLTPETKSLLMEYSACTDVHSTLNITFGELLTYVFDRIQSNANSDEIKKVLNIEMADSVCKCFTGRISRLINCLNGFDPLVSIQISDSEQIAQIIKIVAYELTVANSYTVELHRKSVADRLTDLGYASDTINLWIENIE